MKYPALQSFADVLPCLDEFDAIIDVRSEAEFALDHIPGAVNCPVLDNEERIRIGTIYKQVNTFEAKKIGAALVAKNIARHIEQLWLDKPRDWKPLIYCWRGGNRSGAMAHVLAKIGWPAIQLDGGYKAYRAHVSETLAETPALQFKVICGTTGSGKSRLLEVLDSIGAQVLDLEQLARHRGSVLGNLPDVFAERNAIRRIELDERFYFNPGPLVDVVLRKIPRPRFRRKIHDIVENLLDTEPDPVVPCFRHISANKNPRKTDCKGINRITDDRFQGRNRGLFKRWWMGVPFKEACRSEAQRPAWTRWSQDLFYYGETEK